MSYGARAKAFNARRRAREWTVAVFKAHRLLYHSTLGLRVIKKNKSLVGLSNAASPGSPRSKVDGFIPRTQQVNLRIVSE